MKYLWIFGLIILASCSSNEQEAPSLPKEADDGIRSESFGVEYLFSDSLRLKARMHGTHVIEKSEAETEDQDPEVVFYIYEGVEVRFFDYRGDAESFISANEGIYWQEKGLAELKGEVVLRNINGEKLETEQLFWDEKGEKIYTEQFVRVQTKGKIITADSGLVSNTSFTNYEFRGVRGEFEYEEDGF